MVARIAALPVGLLWLRERHRPRDRSPSRWQVTRRGASWPASRPDRPARRVRLHGRRREIGHLHGDRAAHFSVPKEVGGLFARAAWPPPCSRQAGRPRADRRRGRRADGSAAAASTGTRSSATAFAALAAHGALDGAGSRTLGGAMASENSFDARAELEVGGRAHEIYRLEALQERYDVARLPFSLKVLLENVLRNEDGVGVRREDIEALATLGREGRPVEGDRLHAGARDPAGLHRRAVRRRPRRDARRDGRHGRRPAAINPLVPGRARDRPLRPGRRLRLGAGVPDQRGEGVRAQPGALRVPALGPDRVRGLQGGAAGHRASSTRSTWSTSRASCSTTTGCSIPTRSSGRTPTRR